MGKTVRVMLSVPPDFLKEIDEQAKLEYRSRSELVREALRQYMAEKDRVLGWR